MTTIMNESEDFLECYKKEKLPIVIYGAGKNFEKYIDKVPQIDMVCDKKRAGEMIHDYHRNDVKEVDKKKFGLSMGLYFGGC